MGPCVAMEEEIERVEIDPSLWDPISPSTIADEHISELIKDLLQAKNPVVVTSYLGKKEAAVHELVTFCNRLAIPVIESVPQTMNFPFYNKLHSGYQWNENKQHPILEEADFVLVIDKIGRA